MAAPQSQRDPRNLSSEIPSITQVMRDFGGMNVSSPRMSIRDDQFSWLENYMPIAAGNLASVNGPLALGTAFASKTVTFSTTVNISGVDYVVVFLSDGSADYVTAPGGVAVQFAAANTFTAPYAISYADETGTSGVLIVDPVKGYYDFGVTTAFTLTNLNQGITSVTPNAFAAVPYEPITGTVTGGGGSGAILQSTYTVSSMAITAAGTGYVVGDVLTIYTGIYTTPTMITVTAIGGGGTITAVTFTGGEYTGPTTGTAAFVGFPGASAGTGGTGSGATFTGMFLFSTYTILNPGSGYTSAPTAYDRHLLLQYTVNATTTVGGLVLGTTLAAYAGRVWIASGKSVTYTDIDSYNSFGGAGGQFTINDSYLHNAVNALYSSNGYLYIFGDDSIDVLSNVQVTSGVTSFSRQNITTSIGTSYPQSVTAYYRSVMFANNYGYYSLSGATPQKISDDLDGLFTPGTLIGDFVAGTVTVLGILCVCWTIRIVDSFTTLYGTNTTRTLMMIFFKGKWYAHYPGFDLSTFVTIPTGGVQTLYGYGNIGANSQLYELFSTKGATLKGMVQTKLWDGGQPMLDKEVIRVGFGANYSNTFISNLTLTSDNEYTQSLVTIFDDVFQPIQWENNSGQIVLWANNSNLIVNWQATQSGYLFGQGKSSTMGGKYFGMTLTTAVIGDLYLMFAMDYRATRVW